MSVSGDSVFNRPYKPALFEVLARAASVKVGRSGFRIRRRLRTSDRDGTHAASPP